MPNYDLMPWLGQPADVRRLPFQQQAERERQTAMEESIRQEQEQRLAEQQADQHAEYQRQAKAAQDKLVRDSVYAGLAREVQSDPVKYPPGTPAWDSAMVMAQIQAYGGLPAGGTTAMVRGAVTQPKAPTTTPPPDWAQQAVSPPAIPRSPVFPVPGLQRNIATPAPVSAEPAPVFWNGRELRSNPAYPRPVSPDVINLRRDALTEKTKSDAGKLTLAAKSEEDRMQALGDKLRDAQDKSNKAVMLTLAKDRLQRAERELTAFKKTSKPNYIVNQAIAGVSKEAAEADYEAQMAELSDAKTRAELEMAHLGGAAATPAAAPKATGKRWIYNSQTGGLDPAP